MIINLDCRRFVSIFWEDNENMIMKKNYSNSPLFAWSINMQDKRVSRNEAGYSKKHRPAVQFGDFEMYSIFESTVLTLLQFETKSKNSQWFRDKLSIPVLHLPSLSFCWGKQSVRRSAEHLWNGQKPKPTFCFENVVVDFAYPLRYCMVAERQNNINWKENTMKNKTKYSKFLMVGDGE